MATPTGQISFGDLNTEIMQAGSTTQRNMNDAGVRLGYGSTAQLSISQLKKAWAATVTEGTSSDKYGSYYGFQTSPNPNPACGSIDDSTITSGGSYLFQTSYGTFGGSTVTQWDGLEAGFRATAITRWAIGGTNITGFSAVDDDGSPGSSDYLASSASAYGLDGSGTVTIGLKWN